MLHINWGNNKDVDLKCCLSSKLSTARPGQSKNLYYSKRDVSATVDMTSSRFFRNVGQLLYYYHSIN